MFKQLADAWRRGYLIVGGVVSLLAILTVSSSAADPAPHVWFVDSKTLSGIDPATNQIASVVSLDNPARALAVDPQDRSVWALHNADLLNFSETGALQLGVDLRSISTTLDHPMALALDSYDRSVWVASQNTLLHVSGDGQGLLQWQSPDNVQALGLDIDESVWVLTRKQLIHLAASGTALDSADLSTYVINPGYLAIDNLAGSVWVAAYNALIRFDVHHLNQPQVVDLPLPTGSATQKIDALAADTVSGTLDVVSRNMLYLYDRTGTLIKSVDFTPQNLGTIQTIAYDPSSLSLWLGGNGGLARFTGSGDFVARWPVSNAANAIGVVPFKLRPTLSLENPSNNGLLNNPQPTITLGLGSSCNSIPCLLPDTYLRSLSFDISLNGQAVGTLFTIIGTDAVFTPSVRLPEGMNFLAGNATDLFGHQSESISADFTIDTIPPKFVSLSPADGSNVTTSTALIQGTIDDPTASITLIDATGQVVSLASGANFSFAVDLIPGTNTFSLIARDPAGNETTTVVHLTFANITLTLANPLPNATLDSTALDVSGTFQGPPNTGITINGVVAMIYGDQFYANLDLEPGVNTLTITATTPDGTTITRTMTVTVAASASDPIKMTVEPQSGVAPLPVQFTIDNGSGLGLAHIDADLDSDGTTDFTTTDATIPVSYVYSSPGVYLATIRVTDSQGIIHRKQLIVVINDAAQMDQLFASLWNNMNNALKTGNIDGAAQYLNESAKRKYRPVFEALRLQFPQIITSYSPLRRILISEDIGEYAVVRTFNGQNRLYLVYFLRDADGVWRLDAM